MVEVYHSARLDCAASHELMMNAGSDGERADCCREPAEGWTREQRCESQMRMGSFGGHDQPLCRLLKRSGCQEVERSGKGFISLQVALFFFFFKGRFEVSRVCSQSASSDLWWSRSGRVIRLVLWCFWSRRWSETGGESWLEILQMTLSYLPDSSSFRLPSSGGSPVLARSCSRFLLMRRVFPTTAACSRVRLWLSLIHPEAILTVNVCSGQWCDRSKCTCCTDTDRSALRHQAHKQLDHLLIKSVSKRSWLRDFPSIYCISSLSNELFCHLPSPPPIDSALRTWDLLHSHTAKQHKIDILGNVLWIS